MITYLCFDVVLTRVAPLSFSLPRTEPTTTPESVVTFTEPLSSQITPVSGHVTFECQVSQPVSQVTWCKGGEPIALDDTTKYEVVADGTKHKLVVHDCLPEDAAEYTVMVGAEQCAADLTVQGTTRWPPSSPGYKTVVHNQCEG